MRARPLLGIASLLVVASASAPAAAFCRTSTSHVPADYDPSISGCWPRGYPLFWKSACVSYDLEQSASKQISYDTASADIALAFTRWTTTTCSNTGHGAGRVSIDVRDFGPVGCDQVQYNNVGGPNQNVIVFRDDEWPYDDTSNTLALTTVTYDPATGQIYDADMEINTFQYTLSTTPQVPKGGYDFLAIVTHETGHFLGMAHATDTHATMYAHYTPGSEAMRNLTDDDILGICTIYAPDGTRSVAPAASKSGRLAESACDPSPMGGFTSQCMSTGGCDSSSMAPAHRAADAWAALVVGGALVVVRRRKGRRRAPPRASFTGAGVHES